MDKSKRIKVSKSKFKAQKQKKMKKRMEELIDEKTNEKLNSDIEIVHLRGTDPSILVGRAGMGKNVVNVYLSYRKCDIESSAKKVEKDSSLFDITPYLVVINASNKKLVTHEPATKAIEEVVSKLTKEEKDRMVATLQDYISMNGLVDVFSGGNKFNESEDTSNG